MSFYAGWMTFTWAILAIGICGGIVAADKRSDRIDRLCYLFFCTIMFFWSAVIWVRVTWLTHLS